MSRREESGSKPSSQTKRRRPYTPPRLERLGSVRDVLAKSGPSGDQPKTHPKRP